MHLGLYTRSSLARALLCTAKIWPMRLTATSAHHWKRQLTLLRAMDRRKQPIIKILDPFRSDWHLRIHDHDNFIERQPARFIFRQ